MGAVGAFAPIPLQAYGGIAPIQNNKCIIVHLSSTKGVMA